MQKRVIGYFDGLATSNVHTANVHTAKTNKVQPASQTEKTRVSGFYKARKIAVVLMLLVFSVFCAIGSADWIISQQMKIEGGTTSPGEQPKSAFELDESALQAHIEIRAGETEATVPSKARANSPSDAASATTTAAANATAANVTSSVYNGTALTVKLNNKPKNAAKNLVENASSVTFTTKYVTWNGSDSLTTGDFTAATEGMPINVGKYAIYVQLSGYTGENGTINLGYAIKYYEITPCPVTITWGSTEFTYNGTAQQPTYTHTALCGSDKLNLKITQNNAEVTEAKNAGTYTATLSASANYALSNNTTEFTITQKNVTIKWENTSFIYNGKAQISTATTTDLLNGDTLNVSGAQTNAGEYKAEATASANYEITNPECPFTIKPYELIIEWSNTELTYNGEEQKPTATITNPISGITMPGITVSGSKKNAGENYEATVRVDDTNYTIKSGESTKFIIKKLDVKLTTLIQKDYAEGGVLFYSSLITFDNDLNDLAKKEIKVDLSGAKAENFTPGTASETAGLFSYAYNQNEDVYIKAGSTYLISGVKFSNTNNFNITNNTAKIYLKYQTAKVGDKYYTIEDALAASGDITLAGNDSNYVITSFCNLFSYYNKTEYEIASGRTLKLQANLDDSLNKNDEKTGTNKVYSALIITDGIELIVNGTVDINAHIAANNGNYTQSKVFERSVIMNNGKITANGTINARGYLKGNGNGVVELNGTINDFLCAYDWAGGTVATQYSDANIFPFEAYSIHNVSCDTIISKTATYKATIVINISDTVNEKTTKTVNLVAPSKAMFSIVSGTVTKTTQPANSTPNDDTLTTISGDNQIKGQRDVIFIDGVCNDNSITIDATILNIGLTITTSPSYPLPLGYMDLVVNDGGILNLQAVSYKFMPGSSVTVNEGATLNVKNNISLTFYGLDDCVTDEAMSGNSQAFIKKSNNKYSGFAVDFTNAVLNVSGNVNVSETASLSGIINATGNNALLNFNGTTSTTTIVATSFPYSSGSIVSNKVAGKSCPANTTNKTYNAAGLVWTSASEPTTNSNFTSGTYKSDGTNWYKTGDYTITYDTQGGTLPSNAKTTGISGEAISDLPTPTKLGYKFDYWTYNGKQVTTADVYYYNINLVAHWEAKEYTINFVFENGQGNLPSQTFSGNSNVTLPQLDSIVFNGQTLSFAGWYKTQSYTGNAVSTVGAIDADVNNTITVYAKFSASEPYKVIYKMNPEELDFIEKLNDITDTDEDYTKLVLRDMSEYNSNIDFNFAFLGWYSDENFENKVENIDGTTKTLTLYAKWEAKKNITITNNTGYKVSTSLTGNDNLTLDVNEVKTFFYTNGTNVKLGEVSRTEGKKSISGNTAYIHNPSWSTNVTTITIVNDTELSIIENDETYYMITFILTKGKDQKKPAPDCSIKIKIPSGCGYDENFENHIATETTLNNSQTIKYFIKDQTTVTVETNKCQTNGESFTVSTSTSKSYIGNDGSNSGGCGIKETNYDNHGIMPIFTTFISTLLCGYILVSKQKHKRNNAL